MKRGFVLFLATMTVMMSLLLAGCSGGTIKCEYCGDEIKKSEAIEDHGRYFCRPKCMDEWLHR